MDIEGARTFQASADAYDRFMGRYSRELAGPFAALCLPDDGSRFLDVGCGPGALTTVAVDALGVDRVSAVDPAPGFVDACRARHPGLDVRQAAAEALPFSDATFGAAAAQLVFHFLSDPARGASEMLRVVRPGGVVAAAVWDFGGGMEMLGAFWDAARDVDPQAPDEARILRFGAEGELAELLTGSGLDHVEESAITVSAAYADSEEVWDSFLTGVGPAGTYLEGLPPEGRRALRSAFIERLGSPASSFRLGAVARVVRGVVAP